MRLHQAVPLAAILLVLGLSGAQAAVSVIGPGPAKLCYVGADRAPMPSDYLIYCNLALATGLNDRDRAATYINRGVIKLTLRRYDSAAADFTAGLAIDDQLGEGYVDLAATEIANKHYADAIGHINKGLSLGTTLPQNAYYDRALANEGLGNYREAYDDYRQALTIAPDFTLASDQLKRFKVVEKTSGT